MERIPLVVVDGYPGVGAVIQENAHFAVIEFRMYRHRWELVVDSEDYEIIGYVTTPHELLEEM